MKKIILLHPLLFAIYPVLFLYSRNTSEAFFSDTFAPICIGLAGAIIVTGLLWLYFRNIEKATLAASVFILLFAYYGTALHIFHDKDVGFLTYIIYKRFLLILFVGIFIYFSYKVNKSGETVRNNLNKIFTLTVSFLVGFSLFTLAFDYYKTLKKEGQKWELAPFKGKVASNQPDVYYIILDTYANQTTLKEIFNYDNSEFLDYLRDNGFYVADHSHCNYPMTPLSLASSLNMNYLSVLAPEFKEARDYDFSIPFLLIQKNEVGKFLKSRGYEFVSFNSGWGPTAGMINADVFYTNSLDNDFVANLIHSSMLVLFANKIVGDKVRKRQLNYFSKLGQIEQDGKPKFVFAHFMMPHEPYLFKADGQPQVWKGVADQGYTWEWHKEYIEQLRFTNTLVKTVVKEIISRSKNPPIIVLQSDHGSGHTFNNYPQSGGWEKPSTTQLKERMRNLSAFYLPDKADSIFYDTITPVNIFRKIFNHYFNASFEYLDDQSYFTSAPPGVFNFKNVTDSVRFDK